jgi:hypothetical protein
MYQLAKIPAHQDPIVLLDYGLTGTGSVPWGDAMTTLMTALRSDFGVPHMKVILIRAPYTFISDGAYAATTAAQNAYAATDPYCYLAWNDTMTYVDNTTLAEGQHNGSHFDRAGGRKLAVGPDDTTTQSVLTAMTSLLSS